MRFSTCSWDTCPQVSFTDFKHLILLIIVEPTVSPLTHLPWLLYPQHPRSSDLCQGAGDVFARAAFLRSCFAEYEVPRRWSQLSPETTIRAAAGVGCDPVDSVWQLDYIPPPSPGPSLQYSTLHPDKDTCVIILWSYRLQTSAHKHVSTYTTPHWLELSIKQ